MADTDKKFSIGQIFFLIAVLLWLFFHSGCASQTRQMPQMDSTHYVAQVQPQDYPCPYCGYLMKNISENIRIENKCPNCGEIFFGKSVVEKKEKTTNYQRGYGNYGPRNYGPTSVYQSDVNYQNFGVGGYSFKEISYGFSELSWYFHDSKVKSRRVIPRWTTTIRYHYP